ncbi:MAG: cation:proton antiporter [Melioribacteraceae bacterium]|nr:cation:proton antiporter [Melioribacteraceae bacterium]
MNVDSIIFEICIIIVGSAILGTLFLYAKQPIIIAYILIGIAIGPYGFGLIKKTGHIEQISHFGVILLLFLIGLNLQPVKLLKLFRKVSLLTLSTSLVFGLLSFVFSISIGFNLIDSIIVGSAMMFSSTVVSLKLLPTTSLHNRHIGEMMTSILVIQDVLAILIILFIQGERGDNVLITFIILALKFIVVLLLAFLGVKFIVIPLLTKFDMVQEYTFVVTLAWCLLFAEGAYILGLSYEMGAFVAGLSIASFKVAEAIAEHLKPLREFFLILFFFAIGSKLNLDIDIYILLSALLFGIILVPVKAFIYKYAFHKSGESKDLSKRLGVRLGQSSEFSLLVTFSAISIGLISTNAAMFIQITTIITFIISTYWVVKKYPNPIADNSKLRQD